MRRTLVVNVAGLSASFIGDRTPHLTALARRGGTRLVKPVLPAVGPVVEATYTTGLLPKNHGCVGTGWYSRELGEVQIEKGSSRLVEGEKIWEVARKLDPSFTSASIFWSHGMYGTNEWSVSPYRTERAGRIYPDVHTHPGCLRGELKKELGELPREPVGSSGLATTRWIARCARHIYDARQPTLTLVSLPFLDRTLQRLGPDHPDLGIQLEALDKVVGELIEHAARDGARVIVLSSHAVVPVSAPVHINRALRNAQLLAVRDELGVEVIDPGASDAFAVVDHQLAHVYVRRPEQIAGVKALLAELPGVEQVLDKEGMRAHGLDHARAGELVAIAAPDRWFTYYWWSAENLAPDWTRTIDPTRKPGSDPGELFLDPSIVFPQLKLAWKALVRALGFRSLLDVVPLDGNVVRGSYGRVSNDTTQCPVLVTSEPDLAPAPVIDATEVKRLVLDHVFDAPKKLKKSSDPTPVPSHHLQLLTQDAIDPVVQAKGYSP